MRLSKVFAVICLISLAACARQTTTPVPTSGLPAYPITSPEANTGGGATNLAPTAYPAPATSRPAPTFTLLPPLVILTPADTSAWQTTTLELFSLTLNLPPGWTAQETNRRPEPTDPGDPQRGHDCADYLLTSGDGQTIITLKPTCGFAEGGSGAWPDDTVVVTQLSDNKGPCVVRFFDSSKSIYVYSLGYVSTEPNLPPALLTNPPSSSTPPTAACSSLRLTCNTRAVRRGRAGRCRWRIRWWLRLL